MAGKTPITLEAMVLLLRAQGQSLKVSYEKRLAEKDSQIPDQTAEHQTLNSNVIGLISSTGETLSGFVASPHPNGD